MIRRAFGPGSGLTVLSSITVLGVTGQTLPVGDRLSHFSLYWALLAVGFAAWAAYGKRWNLGAFGAVLFIVHASPVASLWLPPGRGSQATAGSSTLTVVSANLYKNNARRPEALAKLLQLLPDVLLLMEVGPEWRPVLEPVLQRYPHSLDSGGRTMLLSTHPIRAGRCTPITLPGLDSYDVMLEATVILPETAVRLVGIHPPPPRSSARVAQQSGQAVEYASALWRDKDAPHQVLIGDFNTTPFSAVFRHIVRTTGLRDTAKGWGYHPTWGPRLPREPLLPWLGIPIDHALVSDRVVVENRRVGEMPGSDHRYQLIKLRF